MVPDRVVEAAGVEMDQGQVPVEAAETIIRQLQLVQEEMSWGFRLGLIRPKRSMGVIILGMHWTECKDEVTHQP